MRRYYAILVEKWVRVGGDLKEVEQNKLLEIKNLKTYFYTLKGIVKAVDGVSLEIYPGETLGIVGESGCGKSVTALSILQLFESPPGKIVAGEINFDSHNLTTFSDANMRTIRGKKIAMIFQEPMTSLNPLYTVGNQISETIRAHKKGVSKKEALNQAIDMLRKVDIPLPEKRIHEYPHQLSGGMRQRVMIAMALSCEPKLLIADEPTTALDVTVQARVLEVMENLQQQLHTSIMMITHDLGVVAETCDRVAVMYAGRIVEYTNVTSLFTAPRHPYTWGLMKSIPRVDTDIERLQAIPGIVPSLYALPEGCKYTARCPLSDEICTTQEPELEDVESGHAVRCWHSQQLLNLSRQN